MTRRSPATNIEIIFTDWLDALRRGDTARMAARLAPDAVHEGVRPEWICRNRQEILTQVGRRAGGLPSVEAIELVAAGENVVMSIRAPGVGMPLDEVSGRPRGQACVVFTLREGRIIRMRDYVRRADALEAAGASITWE